MSVQTGADQKDPKDPDKRGPVRQIAPADFLPKKIRKEIKKANEAWLAENIQKNVKLAKKITQQESRCLCRVCGLRHHLISICKTVYHCKCCHNLGGVVREDKIREARIGV